MGPRDGGERQGPVAMLQGRDTGDAQAGEGKIINIDSGTFWLGVPYLLHYVSSKGAVIAFTRALARELSGSGINVNAVTPGFTMTEAAKGIADRETFEQFRQQIVDLQIIK